VVGWHVWWWGGVLSEARREGAGVRRRLAPAGQRVRYSRYAAGGRPWGFREETAFY